MESSACDVTNSLDILIAISGFQMWIVFQIVFDTL